MLNRVITQLRSSTLVLGSVVLALLVIAVSLTAHLVATQNITSWKSVVRTHAVLTVLQNVMTLLFGAEAGTRGYVVTGDEHFLDAYAAAVKQLPAFLSEIKRETEQDSVQQVNVARFESTVLERLDRLTQAVEFRRAHSFDPHWVQARASDAQRLTDRVRQIAAEIREHELQLLRARERKSEINSQWLESAAIAFVFTGLLLCAVLLVQALRIKRLQKLVTVCAWTRSVKYQGQWISFEQFLEERFQVDITHGISDSAADEIKREMEGL